LHSAFPGFFISTGKAALYFYPLFPFARAAFAAA